ncbi:MAG: OmpH family outer membrane protein [Thermodesulfobacteriota bacterium]
MTKLGRILWLTVILALTPVWVGAAELKIGVVDTVAITSADVKRIDEKMKRKAEEMGRPLAQRRQDIGRQWQEFEKQAPLMKEDARKRREEEFQKKQGELQQQAMQADQTLARLYEQEMAPVRKKLEEAVAAVARDEKIDLILPKATIILCNKSIDITEKVRSRYR